MKMWKRVLSVMLATILVMGLGACNKDLGGNKPSGGKKNNVNAELAKQYVYRMTEFDLSGLQDAKSDNYLRGLAEVDSRIYMVMETYHYHYDDEVGEESDGQDLEDGYRLLSMNLDGSDLKVIDLQLAMDGEETDKKTSAAPDIAVPEGAESGEEETTPAFDVYESTSFSEIKIVGKRLVGMKNYYYYYYDFSNPENSVNESKSYVCAWDLDGNMLWETPVDLLADNESWHYICGFAGTKDGGAVMLIGGDDTGRMLVESNGSLSPLEPVQGLEQFFMNSSQCAVMADGQLFLTYYGEDWTKFYGIVYNPKTNVTGPEIKFSDSVSYNMGSFVVDANGDILYSNGQGIFKYHPGDEEAVQMMSYINSDLDMRSMSNILPIDEERFVGMYNEYDYKYYNSTVKGGIFTRVDPQDVPDREVLVLGGRYIDSNMKKRVIAFNKSSETHRIVVRDYSQYNSYDDYNGAFTQLNSDIIAGKMPDILIVDSYSMNLENYISKGLLADIGKLMEQDEELSKMEFLDNVFEACEVDGKLYEVVPSFYVQTYVGKTSVVGDRSGWTMEDARSLLATMPGETQLFGDMLRADFFYTMMHYCGSDFINVSTGTCSFDSDAFIELMEYAKELPEERPEDYYEGDWYVSYESQYRENRTLLAGCYISRLQDMVYTVNGSFGEDVSYIGFPTASGQGSVLSTSTTYALAARSDNLDVAWDFVRYYLTDEYQDELLWELPVNKKSFGEQALAATKNPTYENPDGEIVEDEYTNWVNGERIVLDPLTMEQLEKLKNFIYTVSKRAYNNEEVNNIISEEMDAFYRGQKSARDVASIIQGRVQVYVDENS